MLKCVEAQGGGICACLHLFSLVWSTTVPFVIVFDINVLCSPYSWELFSALCNLWFAKSYRYEMWFPLFAHIKGLHKPPVLRSAVVFGNTVAILHRWLHFKSWGALGSC